MPWKWKRHKMNKAAVVFIFELLLFVLITSPHSALYTTQRRKHSSSNKQMEEMFTKIIKPVSPGCYFSYLDLLSFPHDPLEKQRKEGSISFAFTSTEPLEGHWFNGVLQDKFEQWANLESTSKTAHEYRESQQSVSQDVCVRSTTVASTLRVWFLQQRCLAACRSQIVYKCGWVTGLGGNSEEKTSHIQGLK